MLVIYCKIDEKWRKMEKIIKIEVREIIIENNNNDNNFIFWWRNLRRDEKQVLICFRNKKNSNFKEKSKWYFINSIFVGGMSSLMSPTQALVE